MLDQITTFSIEVDENFSRYDYTYKYALPPIFNHIEYIGNESIQNTIQLKTINMVDAEIIIESNLIINRKHALVNLIPNRYTLSSKKMTILDLTVDLNCSDNLLISMAKYYIRNGDMGAYRYELLSTN